MLYQYNPGVIIDDLTMPPKKRMPPWKVPTLDVK